MGRIIPEAAFYHSLTRLLLSNYEKLTELRQHYASWEAAWLAYDAQASAEDLTESVTEVFAAWEKLAALGIHLTLHHETSDNPTGYPALLKEIPHAPFGIYWRGNAMPDWTHLEPTMPTTVAIVGTRKASEASQKLARSLAQALASAGCTIISGLALGVDSAAHQGALDAGGTTIAVLAHGLEWIYPIINEKLAQRILDHDGAIVSEYPPGSPAHKHHFIERNRIISGLARGIVVIEAPPRSGSLATAKFALEQNREIFAVPGPAQSAKFAGSHNLIRKSGAELVTKPEHILEGLGIVASTTQYRSLTYTPKNDTEKKIIALLHDAGTALAIDKIINLSELEVQVVSETLSFLVLNDILEETAIGYQIKNV